jgi:Tfp pilus assembly protein PilF
MPAPRFLVLLPLALLLSACAAPATGPYATPTGEERDGLEAQALTQRAADLIDSDPDKAEQLLRDALSADIFHGPAHNNLGTLYLEQGKLYEAANEFEWAGKVMPGHPDPRMNLGLTLERAGRIDEAIASYDTALEVYPGHLPTIQALCRCQVRYGRADERTKRLLEQIALRGDTQVWREWARRQLIGLGTGATQQ